MSTMMIPDSRRENHEWCGECCYHLPTKKDRQAAKQRQRQIEKRRWRKEMRENGA